jgi:hypothetical protein
VAELVCRESYEEHGEVEKHFQWGCCIRINLDSEAGNVRELISGNNGELRGFIFGVVAHRLHIPHIPLLRVYLVIPFSRHNKHYIDIFIIQLSPVVEV